MNFPPEAGLGCQMQVGSINVDCALMAQPDAATVDCIARVRLAANERRCDLRLDNVSPRLAELIDFCGLAELLAVEVERQPE